MFPGFTCLKVVCPFTNSYHLNWQSKELIVKLNIIHKQRENNINKSQVTTVFQISSKQKC